ncbi:MAG TPA: DNA translocase FtsK, partial [Candidatus Paceibacterota bacterium]
ENFQGSGKPLLVALGRDIAGASHFADLAKMPHLLIAGATGSGKSVTIHAIITSLLYRAAPEDLRFIMIDPKRVELTLYNSTPHLLTPVITDAKKAILALKWLGKEMDRRYDILETERVRDIDSYHKNICAPALAKAKGNEATLPEMMPYIVVVIDELADIMQSYPKELEAAVVRLAQMSRAVGIHLILSTQRPSVNVITGLIKANIPARIALQVASQIDSRTILDGAGAEKLLGAGDMLYISAEMSKPVRIQGAYISEQEVKRVTKFLLDHNGELATAAVDFTAESARPNALFSSSFDEENIGDEDDLYDEARSIVMEAGKASTSYLQRRLRVGYARAARLVDMLEERGVIGPSDGAKARLVISRAESDEGYGEGQ